MHRGPMGAALHLIADVSLHPDMSQLPGGSALQNLTDGIGAWALVAALLGVVIGAASWALGAHTQNWQQSYSGRKTVLVSGLAALLIGLGPTIVNFFFHTGASVSAK